MAAKTCAVSVTGPSGIRHRVDVTAESVYEAAVLGVHLLKQGEWVEPIATGTAIEIEVMHPSTKHTVTVAQLRRWVDGTAASPDETLKKRRLRGLLAG
jgi:hypothetical protein